MIASRAFRRFRGISENLGSGQFVERVLSLMSPLFISSCPESIRGTVLCLPKPDLRAEGEAHSLSPVLCVVPKLLLLHLPLLGTVGNISSGSWGPLGGLQGMTEVRLGFGFYLLALWPWTSFIGFLSLPPPLWKEHSQNCLVRPWGLPILWQCWKRRDAAEGGCGGPGALLPCLLTECCRLLPTTGHSNPAQILLPWRSPGWPGLLAVVLSGEGWCPAGSGEWFPFGTWMMAMLISYHWLNPFHAVLCVLYVLSLKSHPPCDTLRLMLSQPFYRKGNWGRETWSTLQFTAGKWQCPWICGRVWSSWNLCPPRAGNRVYLSLPQWYQSRAQWAVSPLGDGPR